MKIQGTQYSRYPERNFRAFPPSQMLLTPESQTTELEFCRAPVFPSGNPRAPSKPSISFQGFITGRYVRVGPIWANPVASRTAPEMGGWTRDHLVHRRTCSLAPKGSTVGACANGTWSTLLDSLKWRARKWTGQGQDKEQMDSTVVALRKAGPQTRTCYDTNPLGATSYQSCCLTIRGSDTPEQCPAPVIAMAFCTPSFLAASHSVPIERCNLSTSTLENLTGPSTYFAQRFDGPVGWRKLQHI